MAKQGNGSKGGPPARVDQALQVTPDEQTLAEVGRKVLDFLSGLRVFFAKAQALELRAEQMLEGAQTWTAPTSALEDERMQQNVLAATDAIKEAETHWTITTAVSRFHKTLTGARARTTDKLEEVKRLGNNYHNTYATNERRRVERENEERRQAAERQAREDRDREAAKAEEEAQRREAAAPTLSEREERFVNLVMAGHTGAVAAQTAGYKGPADAGARLLGSDKIQKAIGARQEAIAIRQQAEARKAEPLDVQHEDAKPAIRRASGAHDATTHSAELFDENKLIAAIISGGLGIPWDILTVKPAKLNEYARSMRERINAWPGVRYKSETGVRR